MANAGEQTATGTEGGTAATEPKEGGTATAKPNEGEGAAGGTEGNDAKPAEGQGGEGEVEDKHGHPGINREKYQRDMKAKDEEIAKLQAQLDEKSKTEEGRAELKKQMDELKAEMADERTTHKLELAGCRNVKAAKALLDDYEGDVSKLKGECPYLFEEKQTGSTGLKHEGDAGKGIDAKLDRIFGGGQGK